jgi:NAD dependent epimerase/dehydratase family enzyme
LVHSDPRDEAGLIVSEVKWKQLSPAERRKFHANLEQRWERSALRHRYAKVRFAVLDVGMLGRTRK